MENLYTDSKYTRTLESIIELDHDLASYIVSTKKDESFLYNYTKKILELSCNVLGFKQGEIRLFLDENGNIPKTGNVENNWKILKPVVSIGFEEGEEYTQDDIYTREFLLDPKNMGPIVTVLKGKTIQIYRNKKEIEKLVQEGTLRENYWSQYLEEPPTQDNRNIFIPVTRKLGDGLLEVPAYANFSVPNYKINEDEPVPQKDIVLAQKAVDRVSGALIYASQIDELRKAQTERERLAGLASIGTIAGEVSHDIGNLATMIKQNTNLALKNLKKGAYHEVEKKLQASLEATQGLNLVSRRFKNIAPTSGKYEYVDIHRSLISLLELESSSFEHQGLDARILQDFGPGIKKIYHDVGGLSQVYINLLRNSQRAIIEKKEIMKAKNIQYKPEIKVTTRNLGETIQISFYDNGVGIKEENLEILYDPSFTTKPQSESVGGYGLSSSYRIMKEHKGDIKIRSKEGEYTEVILTLPVRRE